jgi:hemerythrin-like domain-containing protein
MQDHSYLRRALDILDGMVKKMEDGDRIETADAMTIVKFLRIFGIEHHQTLEERVLFSLLVRADQENPIGYMQFEQAEQRALVTAIDDALSSKRGREFVQSSRALSELLRSHCDREDSALRAIDGGTLSNDEDTTIVAEFTKGRRTLESYPNFSRLEWKYRYSH